MVEVEVFVVQAKESTSPVNRETKKNGHTPKEMRPGMQTQRNA